MWSCWRRWRRYCAKKRLVLAGREVAVDPGLADQRDRFVVGAGLEQRLRVADPAARGQRRPLGEERADQRMVGGIADRLLGHDLQLVGIGPVRVGHEEAGHGCEVGRLAVLDHAQPAQGLGRQGIGDLLEQAPDARPFAALGLAKRLADHGPSSASSAWAADIGRASAATASSKAGRQAAQRPADGAMPPAAVHGERKPEGSRSLRSRSSGTSRSLAAPRTCFYGAAALTGAKRPED